jgi:hypothetical protein
MTAYFGASYYGPRYFGGGSSIPAGNLIAEFRITTNGDQRITSDGSLRHVDQIADDGTGGTAGDSGGTIVGGWFTRGQWHDLKKEIQDKLDAEQKRQEDIRNAAIEAARAKAEEARRAREQAHAALMDRQIAAAMGDLQRVAMQLAQTRAFTANIPAFTPPPRSPQPPEPKPTAFASSKAGRAKRRRTRGY